VLPVKRLVVGSLVVTLVLSGAALAGRGDPEKKITRADQARAKAMLLRKADFAPGVKATPPSRDESDFYCEALDQSDLAPPNADEVALARIVAGRMAKTMRGA